jgi:hypothetical protein
MGFKILNTRYSRVQISLNEVLQDTEETNQIAEIKYTSYESHWSFN